MSVITYVQLRNRRSFGAAALAGAVMSVGIIGIGQVAHASDLYLATDVGLGPTGDGGYWFDPANWANGVPIDVGTNTFTPNINAVTGSQPVTGVVYDPANDLNAPNYVAGNPAASAGDSIQVANIFISSIDSPNTSPSGVSPNTMTMNSGSIEALATVIVGRDNTGLFVQNGGTLDVDGELELGVKDKNHNQNGTYIYNGGTLITGYNPAGVPVENNAAGIRLGSTASSTGTFIVHNTGPAGMIEAEDFTSAQIVNGTGLVNFVYEGANNITGQSYNGGVVPIQVVGQPITDATTGVTTAGGRLALQNYFTGFGSTGLQLTLNSPPSVDGNGVPQPLALFTYQDGISGNGAFPAEFFYGSDTNLIAEGQPITATFGSATYTWDLYYDGSVSFSNSATSQISSISQVGGNTAAGSAGAVVLIGVSSTGTAQPGTWTATASGSWSQSGNWSAGVIPGGVGMNVNFGGAIGAALTVSLDGDRTVGGVSFNNTNAYTITQGSGGSLVLNNGTSAATVTNSGGTHTISAPVVLTGGAVLSVANGGDTLDISGNVSGSGGVSVQGAGTVNLGGANSFGGGVTVSGGTLVISSAGGLPAGSAVLINGAVSVQAGSSATPVVAGNLSGNGTLTVTNSGYLRLASSSGAHTLGGLAVISGATLDVTNNKVVINYGSAADPGAAIQAALTAGYNAGTWTGSGITSSTAALKPAKFAVGYLDGNRPHDVTGGHVAANQVIIAYTLAGDAFLENSVGFDDLVVVAQDFGKTGEDWSGGNFNYDPSGSVGFADLVNVAQNFGASSGVSQGSGGGLSPAWLALSVQPTSVVPEPASLAILAGCAGGLLPRRRRSGNS